MVVVPNSLGNVLWSLCKPDRDFETVRKRLGCRFGCLRWKTKERKKERERDGDENFEGGSLDLVVMGGGSCSRGREFESQYHMVIFSNIYLLSSFAFVFEKTENS